LVWIVIRMIMAVDTANKYNKSLISKQNPILVSQTTAPPDK